MFNLSSRHSHGGEQFATPIASRVARSLRRRLAGGFSLLLLLTASLLTAPLLQSCDGTSKDKNQQTKVHHHRRHNTSILVPTSSGNPYEVMVVVDDEAMWEGYVGRALEEVLTRSMPMLPQEEPMFHVSHITTKHYDRITKLFRNIVIVKINPHFSEPRLKIERDLFSSPQIVMTVEGATANEISTFVTEQTKNIINCFVVEELNRQAETIEERHNIKFDREVEKMFGCHLYIPTDLKKMKIGDHFIWASDDGLSSIQNIVIYSYPYVSEKVFTKAAFCALRDKFMTQIPGEHKGSVMRTNRDYVETENIAVRGRYVQEARGLWEMSKDAMGGPFISHSQVDTVNNRVIVVEGFVYAPDKMKRTMLRRMQAALYTLELPTTPVKQEQDNE